MAILAFVIVPVVTPKAAPPVDPIVAQAASLPKPWEIQVHVLNGAGDINWTRQVASTIQSLAYTVKEVRRADRFDYPRTAVYYPPGHRLIGSAAGAPARRRSRCRCQAAQTRTGSSSSSAHSVAPASRR